jgi:hypothetical protein
MATTLPKSYGEIERPVFKGDTFTLSITQEGFDFSPYTCTATFYDSKGLLFTGTATASTDTIAISATPAQMDLKPGIYFMKLTIDDGADFVQTLLVMKFTVNDLPVW